MTAMLENARLHRYRVRGKAGKDSVPIHRGIDGGQILTDPPRARRAFGADLQVRFDSPPVHRRVAERLEHPFDQ
jgi:hypothetical protein